VEEKKGVVDKVGIEEGVVTGVSLFHSSLFVIDGTRVAWSNANGGGTFVSSFVFLPNPREDGGEGENVEEEGENDEEIEADDTAWATFGGVLRCVASPEGEG